MTKVSQARKRKYDPDMMEKKTAEIDEGLVSPERGHESPDPGRSRATKIAGGEGSDHNLMQEATALGIERSSREKTIRDEADGARKKLDSMERELNDLRSRVANERLSFQGSVRKARMDREELRLDMHHRERALLQRAKARRRFDLETASVIRQERLKNNESPPQVDDWHRERTAEIEADYSRTVALMKGAD